MKLEQSKLDVRERNRTSRLPWRGQFSPALVAYLIESICPDSRTLLDPFCGSGTVLYEAAIKGRSVWGSEINPAAWHLAVLVEIAALTEVQKRQVQSELKALAANLTSGERDLFGNDVTPEKVINKMRGQLYDEITARCIAAGLLIGMGDGTKITRVNFLRGIIAVLAVLDELFLAKAKAYCDLSDARDLVLLDESIEAVITSPPYINVFNYHQNYRPATELLGWMPLEAARSEIGSNRKHRANRFLTVVQYALDMHDALNEMARVMVIGAPLVIVLGRTSNVMGATFKNGGMVRELLWACSAFGPVQCAERSFVNRFGQRIFEDILIARKHRQARNRHQDARLIGIEALREAAKSVPEKNRKALWLAIEAAADVNPSPHLRLSRPTTFGYMQHRENRSDEGNSNRSARRKA